MPSKTQRKRGWLLPEQITEHELICFQMQIPDNDEYRQAFIGHLYQLGKWWNWEKGGLEDRRATEAAAYWRELLHNMTFDCEGGIMFRLRDDPDTDCFVQQSFDGGETWSHAFDKSCYSSLDGLIWQSNTDQILRETRETYDGTPESILTDFPSEWDEETPYATEVICYAISRLVSAGFAVADAIAKGELEETSDQAALGAGVLGIIAAILAVPTLGGSLAAYAGAVGFAAIVGGVAGNAIKALGDDPRWRDADEMEILQCCAYENLKALEENPTQQQLIDAFECGQVEDSFQWLAAQFLKETVLQVDGYLSYLMDVNTLYQIREDIALPCPCEGWCYTFDFTATDGDFSVGGQGLQQGYGMHDTSGWRETIFLSSTLSRTGAQISRAFPMQGNVTEVHMTYSMERGDFNNPGSPYGMRLRLNNTNVSNQINSAPGAWAQEGEDITLTWLSPAGVQCDAIVLVLNAGSRQSATTPGGNCQITRLVLRGNGANPFGFSNCT